MVGGAITPRSVSDHASWWATRSAVAAQATQQPPIPAVIAAGPDKNLWFTDTTGRIGRVTSAGKITLYRLPHTGSSPVGIAAGRDGAVWFTEADGNRIGRITAAGAITEYPLPAPASVPSYIAAGGGTIFFSETGANRIGRIAASGKISEYVVPTAKSRLSDLAAGPDGNLWFLEYAGKKLGTLTDTGAIREFPLPPTSAGPGFLTSGPNSTLWFTTGGEIGDTTGLPTIDRSTTSGVITVFRLPKGSHPAGITSGPDGNMWVADSAGEILRITTAGKVTPFPLKETPTAALLPLSIASGPDGDLWFTAPALCVSLPCKSSIGRITPTGKITLFPVQGAGHS